MEAAALAFATAVMLAAAHLYVIFYMPVSPGGGVRVVEIPKGASFRVIVSTLEKAGVIRDAANFSLAARLMGAVKSAKAGEYEFNLSMNTVEVLDALVSGKVMKHQVTIPEGYNLYDVASLLKEAGLCDEREFIAAATDERAAAAQGLPGPTLEGYLFPDTYVMEKGMSAVEIIGKMTQRFKAVYYSEFDAPSRERGESMSRVVTLASIIEKETGAGAERGLISSVFHNRLRRRIKLQSDPTAIYAIRGFDGNLTRKDLLRKNPYNTYVNYGLPPGPIANPGRGALRAALFPAQGDYLYFVSKNNGTHYFSKNLREHNNAVNLYQRRIKTVKQG
ncbi:MAG: endolytic transglycosylase MltG [Deltaproteobacteria bacterium]|nr:endolytic transglycosylase MltG [Deltaproteobacteria bacterium]